MERRRILGGFFKFLVDPTTLNYAYGKQKTLTNEDWLYETGTINGTYSTITKNNKTYWKLEGRGSGKETVAIINFKTYTANQTVQLQAFDECNSPNDFLAICKLDSLEKSPLQAKLNNSTEQTISFTVPTAGSHFIKVYYYQHNDADKVSYQITTHGTHAGYVRLIPYYNQYTNGYEKPDTQELFIKSYSGWTLVEKPSWVNLNKTSDKSGKKYLTVECQGNPAAARTGSLTLKEKRRDSQITVTINQAANPHPNDIILTLEKAGMVNDKGKTTSIGVKLIGENSFTISNVSSNQYSVTKTNDSTIVIQNNSSNNTGQQNVSFRVTGNNGTIKDINIYEDLLECYCDCNAKDACGCDVEQTYTKQVLACSGCHSGNDNCIADSGTCTGAHSTIICSCYGSAGCTGCHSGQTNSSCTCNNSVGCSGCKDGYTPTSCSCNNSVGCSGCYSGHTPSSCTCNSNVNCPGCYNSYTNSACSCNSNANCSGCYNGHNVGSCSCNSNVTCSGCHSGKTGSSCTCNGTASCSGCHASNTGSSCTCNGNVKCSGCHSGNTGSSCSCNGNVGCSGCYITYNACGCTCNNTHACSSCHSGNTGSSCSCNSTYACSGCHSGNTTATCNDKNNRPWDSTFKIKLTISTSLWTHNTTHYALFKIVKNSVTHWIFVGQEIPINSSIDVALPYNVLGGYIKQAKFYFDGHGTESYIVSNISKQVLQNYPVSISVVSSNRFEVFNRYTDTDIMANNGGNWCSGYEYSSCSCNNSQSCSGCNSGNTAASCSCNGDKQCGGCYSGQHSSQCGCNSNVNCSSCYNSKSNASCSCNSNVNCSSCYNGKTDAVCRCNSSQGCTGCKDGYTDSACTCNTSYACPGCYSGNTGSSCSCNGNATCSGCYSGKTDASCSCNSNVTCSGCKSAYVATSCSCNGNVTCSGCYSGNTGSSCSCNGNVTCSGCHSGKTNVSCTCNNTVACSGCHSGKTNVICSCDTTYACTGCHSGNVLSSCTCNNSVGCSGCKDGYTPSKCTCNTTYACEGCYSGKGPYDCTCNSKLFNPHCDCHQYCPCENYVIPVVN